LAPNRTCEFYQIFGKTKGYIVVLWGDAKETPCISERESPDTVGGLGERKIKVDLRGVP